MRGTSTSDSPKKRLILQLKKVIRADHKLLRQLARKYQSHQALEKVREQLKTEIQKYCTAVSA